LSPGLEIEPGSRVGAGRVVVELDPENVECDALNHIAHINFWKWALGGTRDEVLLGGVVPVHEETEVIDAFDISHGTIGVW
jgi:hypothetical protein